MGTLLERPTRQWERDTWRRGHPLVWKSHKLKQGGTSTLASEPKALSSRLGHLEWIMCMFTTVLFPAFSLENRDTYIQRFSAVSVIDCKSVFDSVTNPGA